MTYFKTTLPSKISRFFLCVFLTLFVPIQYILAQNNVVFPEGAGVIDVTKAPYFAQGDGVNDDTDAINQAMLDHPDGHFIIYLPNGTYKVSDRIDWPRVSGDDVNCSTEQSCRYTILQGQNRDSTIIKLEDSSVGFQDATNRRAVLWCGQGAAQRFRNAVRDLTVNVGSGNPGAAGIQFNANNQGGMFDLKIESDDGQGVYGIDLAYTNEIGPLLVKNIEVDGFQRAISTNFNVNSMTFENITIRNQSEFGVYVQQQVVTMRGLKSFNEVTAVRTRNQGSHLVLIDSDLQGSGNASNLPAVFHGASVFLRNVNTSGYRNAVTFNLNGTTPVNRLDGPFIEEYVSSDVLRLCDNEEKSLNLPIQETPEVPMDDPDSWVNIEDFGASSDKNNMDDAVAIQAALNSGASTIYIPVNSFRNNGIYTISSDVTVPSTVKRIIGTEGGIGGSGNFVIASGNTPLIIERVRAIPGIKHVGDRTLIIKSSNLRGEYSCSSGSDLFLEDVGFQPTTFLNQNVWARQYNVENDGVSIVNDNSSLWILGFKTEKSGTKIKTINGGKTEVLGAHIYSISESSEDFMFTVEDGSLSLAGIRETNFNNDPYPNLIRETRQGITRELVAGEANFGINASGFPLFVGYASEGNNEAPTVTVGDEASLVLPINSITLNGEVNDDGLPGGACFIAHLWTQEEGPQSAIIADPTSLQTSVSFTEPGAYVFKLTADDGSLNTSETVKVFVYEQAITTGDHDADGVASGNGADVYVAQGGGRGSQNYGGATDLRIRNHPGIFDEKVYLKFDVSALDRTVTDAGLSLEISTTNTPLIGNWTYNVFALIESDSYGEGRLDESWSEGIKNGEAAEGNEITYANAPANISSGGGLYDSASNSGGGVDNNLTSFLGTFTLRQGVREIVNLRGEALTQVINEDSNGVITLIITRVDLLNNVITFSAKENTSFSAPTLNLIFTPEPENTVIGEVGVSTTGGDWKQVTLNNSYIDPVVIMGPSSFYDEDMSTIRVRNVTSNSFEWRMEEWEYQDQIHGDEIVNYLVMESGDHTLTNGQRIVAKNSIVERRFTFIDYVDDFNETPIVFAQCVSVNEDQAVITRIRNSSPDSFEVRLQEEENGGTLDGKRRHIPETVSWLAVSIGSNNDEGVNRYESNQTPNAVRHIKWYEILFNESYQNDNRSIFAGMQTFDGGDPALVRYNRNSTTNSFDNNSVEIFLEEELSLTRENGGLGETKHATEVIGYFIFDGTGDINGQTVEKTNAIARFTNGIPGDVEQNLDGSNKWLIYPNPVTNGKLWIDLNLDNETEVRLEIRDLSGKIVRQMDDIKQSSIVVDIADLEGGVYLVRTVMKDETLVRKILKQ